MEPNSNLKFYLKKLNEDPLLTREEEDKLLKLIEARQNKILQDCVSSAFFKSELLTLLKSRNLEDIAKISRKLDQTSTPEDVEKVTKTFVKLVEDLEEGASKATVTAGLSALALSGNIIYALVTKIKAKYAKVEEYERQLDTLVKYFEVSTLEELAAKVEEVKENDTARAYCVIKFQTTEQRLISRIRDYSENVEALKALNEAGIGPENFVEVRALYASIVEAEDEMKGNRDELIRRNLRLVVSRAKKLMNRGLDLEDLIQEGNIGLMKAVNKHDSSRGTKIATYATWWIDQAIRRAISNKGKTVRVPTHIEFLRSQIAAATNELTNRLGRTPTKQEVVDEIDLDIRVLDRLEKAALHKLGIDSENDSGTTLVDFIPSDQSDNPMTLTAQKLLREKIRNILGTLPPRTEKIIRLRFGIGEPHDEEQTLQQIANSVGLTKMGVRLVQNKGLEKLKKKKELREE